MNLRTNQRVRARTSRLSAAFCLLMFIGIGLDTARAQAQTRAYVTNFLDGAVALQTHAAYQTNFQGQPGATSVSVLSNVKYKF